MTRRPTVSKSDIRMLLWDITCLGTELTSTDDDRLDEAALALDSVTMVWLIVHFEQQTGRAFSTEPSLSSAFRTVNAIHSFLTEQVKND